MSAEGKKKRGISGATNAKSIPFRYGGAPCNLSLHIGATTHPRLGGARMLAAMALAVKLPNFSASHRLYSAADETMDHIEHRCGEGRKPLRVKALAA